MLRAMKDHPISQRRACVLIGVDPKTVRRDRPPDNPEIREEMHKIAEKRRRFGYRRVGILLERKGMIMNEKKLYRIYREEGLSVRRRRGRKRARGSRTPIPAPLRPNQRWSLDFLSDDLPPGRPSFITRVLGVDIGWFRVWQARRARSPQIAQALGARRTGSCCPARNGA